MMDRALLEEQLSQLPLYVYLDIDPQKQKQKAER